MLSYSAVQAFEPRALCNMQAKNRAERDARAEAGVAARAAREKARKAGEARRRGAPHPSEACPLTLFQGERKSSHGQCCCRFQGFIWFRD